MLSLKNHWDEPYAAPFLTLVAFFFFSIILVMYASRRNVIYPPLHRNQPVPHTYRDRQAKTIPAQTTINPDVITHGPRTQRVVALTFDADMTPAMLAMLKSGMVKSWYNRAIKETLDTHHAKATVFLGGLWTETYPIEAKMLAQDPLIELGNHSYNHYAFANGCYNLPVIANQNDVDDVSAAQTIIEKTTGVTPKYFRFPGGCYENIDLTTVARLGLTVVHWDVVAGDGFNQNAASIVSAVESQVHNGAIIVFHLHDGTYAPKTDEALTRIIPDLRAKGFQFVTISELLALR